MKRRPCLPEPWPEVLVAEEVACVLRCSTKSVHRYTAKGILPRLPVEGRCLVSAHALREFINGAGHGKKRP